MKTPYLLFFFLVFIFGCAQPDQLFDGALCIQNVTTIDPLDGAKENQTVIIENGKISKVQPTNTIKLSDKNRIIDGTGKYLIPGLWDAHVHFAYIEELAPSMFDLFLRYGITSVRDTGGKINFVKEWKDKSISDPANAPRVKIAGPLLDGMPNVYDGSAPSRPELSVGLATTEDVQVRVGELVSQGVDLLKAYEMLTPEQFNEVIQQSRKHNLKVTGHVPLSMDVITASNAGFNSMEHLRNLELSCASNSDELLAQRKKLLFDGKNDAGGILRSRIHSAQRQIAVDHYDEGVADQVLDVLLKNDTWQIPTLTLNTAFVDRPFGDADWISSFDYLPDSISTVWKSNITAFGEREITDFNHKFKDWQLNITKKIHDKGIPIMAGTDCPIFFLTPGHSLHRELQVLVQAGLTPLEALQTATYNPAKYFGLDKELGKIEERMWADLILLNKDPLLDISNTLSIHTVIRNGEVYDAEK